MTSPFELLPAIDLRGGPVVRLRQGDFDAGDRVQRRPGGSGGGFAASGRGLAPRRGPGRGAGGGARPATSLIGAIAAAVGGRGPGRGRRRPADGRRRAGRPRSGAARAVVGTAALRDPAFAGALVDEHGPERVAVAIDVRDGQAVGSGWVDAAPGPDALDAIALLADRVSRRSRSRRSTATACCRPGPRPVPVARLRSAGVGSSPPPGSRRRRTSPRSAPSGARAPSSAGRCTRASSRCGTRVGRGSGLTEPLEPAERPFPAKFPRVERSARREAAIGPFSPIPADPWPDLAR